jgi:hypothetical protein
MKEYWLSILDITGSLEEGQTVCVFYKYMVQLKSIPMIFTVKNIQRYMSNNFQIKRRFKRPNFINAQQRHPAAFLKGERLLLEMRLKW